MRLVPEWVEELRFEGRRAACALHRLADRVVLSACLHSAPRSSGPRCRVLGSRGDRLIEKGRDRLPAQLGSLGQHEGDPGLVVRTVMAQLGYMFTMLLTPVGLPSRRR